MMDPEDRRAAINMKMTLATNLITVALAFVGAEGGLAVFVLDKRDHLFSFYFVGITALLALAASVVFGGLGITGAYRQGYSGNWVLSDGGRFHFQALFCFLGAALVLFSSVLGNPKTDVQRFDLHVVADPQITELEARVDDLSKKMTSMQKQLATFKNVESRPKSKSLKH